MDNAQPIMGEKNLDKPPKHKEFNMGLLIIP